MNNVFEIEGIFNQEKECLGTLILKDEELYINLPEWIEERNIYDVITRKQIGVVKPHKFGGLTYRVIEFIDEYAEIETRDYGKCLVRITEASKISNYPLYERGNY